MLDAGTIEFSSAALSVADSAGTVPIVLTRVGGSTGAVSVELATSDGTGVAGTNYDALSGSVSFPDTVTTEQVNLTVLPDPVANLPGWTVNLAVTNPSGGASLGTPSAAVLTITHVAAPGDLDGSFGNDGRIDVPTVTALDAFLIAPDGTTYGTSFNDSTSASSFEVEKLQPDGTLDPSFGTDGIATVNLPGSFDYSYYGEAPHTALQPDGKIVVTANYMDSNNNEILEVVRLNTDGTLDSTFGQDGIATLTQPSQFSQYLPDGVTVLSSGQIVVSLSFTGYSTTGTDEVLLADFGPDGSPSLTFGSGGLATSTLGPPNDAGPPISAPVEMPDGTIVGGDTIGGFNSGIDDTLQLALWGFNADGSIDTAFGSGGLALGPMGYYGGQISLAPNGDIVQVGSIGDGGGVVAAYGPTGTLDTSFGSGGETAFGSLYPQALAFQPNGQIIVAGQNINGNQVTYLGVARLDADGSVDTGFGQGGIVTTAGYQGGTEYPFTIASVTGDLIQVAGYDVSETGGADYSELDRYIAPTLQSTPTLVWANPSDIVYGTALGAAQFDATASVPGTFSYSPALGTILDAGNDQTLSVTFTPTDATDYTTATATADINVAQATPLITWANPAPAGITYGTPCRPHNSTRPRACPGRFPTRRRSARSSTRATTRRCQSPSRPPTRPTTRPPRTASRSTSLMRRPRSVSPTCRSPTTAFLNRRPS
jgi:uncharacterized delta-60 repeat protein